MLTTSLSLATHENYQNTGRRGRLMGVGKGGEESERKLGEEDDNGRERERKSTYKAGQWKP